MTRCLSLALMVALFSLCVSRDAFSHSRPMSYSFWTVRPGGAEVKVQITTDDLALLGFDLRIHPEATEAAGTLLQKSLELRRDGTACAASSLPLRLPATESWTLWQWDLKCNGAGTLGISAKFVRLLESGHRHLVRLEDGGGEATDQVLDLSRPNWEVGAPRTALGRRGSSLFDYVLIGVGHLLTGPDHLAFVFLLLLLARRLRDVIGLVTSFTVAHSVTLALSVLGVVQPSAAPVEALIAFSIALLAAENGFLLSGRPRGVTIAVAAILGALVLVGRGAVSRVTLVGLWGFCVCHFSLLHRAKEPAGLRVLVAFAFGLVHGFGFAGAMAHMDLPVGRLASALFGFNTGVELGQLAVVAAAWPLLEAVRRTRGGHFYRRFAEVASAAICGVGVFWFTVRNFG